jgi:hypothetical protein
MLDVIRRVTAVVTSWTRRVGYRCGARLSRWTRAWRYAVERLSADEAQQLMLDCRYPAGWHPLLVLTVEDTLEQARQEIADHPIYPVSSRTAARASAISGNPTTANYWRRDAGRSTSPRITPSTTASHSFCSMMSRIPISDRRFG